MARKGSSAKRSFGVGVACLVNQKSLVATVIGVKWTPVAKEGHSYPQWTPAYLLCVQAG